MKKLLLITLSIFFLSSCSDMRYAGMQKVRQSPTNTVAENQKITAPEIKPVSPQNTGIVFEETESKPFIVKENKKSNTKNLVSKTAEKFNISKKEKSSRIIDTENPTKLSEKNSIEKKQNVKETKIEKGSWLWYLAAGILFIIVGSIITNIVGNILWIIGVVLLVYGLLILIEFI